MGGGQVVSSPMIRVRIPLRHTVFFVKLVYEKSENEQKRPKLTHLFKKL